MLVVFLVFDICLIVTLRKEIDESHSHLIFWSIAIGVLFIVFFVVGALITASRTIEVQEAQDRIFDLSAKFGETQNLLFKIDNETREEVGSWLHGTLQPKLTGLTKEIRASNALDRAAIAQRIDEISEGYVRAYSHSLYPPALMVSLEVGLETLLEGRANLLIDKRLTNASDVGFAMWFSQSEVKSDKENLRLHLGGELAYAAYRIIEEAVANAEKKAETTRITVDVQIRNEYLHISVRDNGEQISIPFSPGLGLAVISAFVQKFNGKMSLENNGDEVELLAELPYRHETVAEMLNKKFRGGRR